MLKNSHYFLSNLNNAVANARTLFMKYIGIIITKSTLQKQIYQSILSIFFFFFIKKPRIPLNI